MVLWDEDAPTDTTGIIWKYYCKIDEEFFYLSPLAPLRCPWCFTDARNIIGPIPIREININDIKRKYDKRK